MSEDWLDIDMEAAPAGLPAVVSVPLDLAQRVAVVEACLARLNPKQRTFLAALRENHFNARAAVRALSGAIARRSHVKWLHDADYATVMRIWRNAEADAVLDRDRALVRQDEIIESLMTPKPILHQGVPTGYYEVDAGAASRANEVILDRVLPKPRADVEVNVGVAFAPVQVEIETPAGAVDAVVQEVEAAPVLPADEDWLA